MTSASPEEFAGQSVIVTGAARGIGLAVSTEFASRGASLVLVDAAPLDEAASAIRALGAEVHPVRVDLADRRATRAALSPVIEGLHSVDVLVNNAGRVSRGSITEITDEDWDLTFAVNITAQLVMTQLVWPRMVAAGRGRLIYMSSRAASCGGVTASAAYVASKGAVRSLVFQVAREGAPHGILANGILPGPIRTEMTATAAWTDESTATPLGRMGQSGEVASVAAFLASAGSTFMTGTVVNLTGGLLMG